jgi:hypothetical protein
MAGDLSLVLDARYCGPPTSANGGYAAGRLAREVLQAAGLPSVGGPWVEVTLRAPVPLATPLTVQTGPQPSDPATAMAAVARDADQLVAEVRVLAEEPVDVAPVPAVDLAAAEQAATGYLGLHVHPFPTCWVCGPHRPPGDGYHLQPGMLDADTTACVWTVLPGHTDADGTLAAEAVWAALDCPGGWTALAAGRVVLLGRLTAAVRDVPRVGEQCVVRGARLGEQGRKTFTATTAYGQDGRVLGHALAVWVAPS